MANAVVQSKTATVDNFGSTTTLSFTTTPTVGRAITVCIGHVGADVTSITDNQGGSNTYSLAIGASHSGSSSTRAFIFRCAKINTSSGTFTITLNTSGTGNYCLWSISEESGALDTSPTDKTSSAESTGTSVTPTTTATTQATEISYVVASGSNNGQNPHGYALPGDYTQIYKEDNAAAHHSGIIGSKVLSATGVQNPTITWTTADTVVSVIATFKAASGGGASVIPQAQGAFRRRRAA
jgi:hypothetical protein